MTERARLGRFGKVLLAVALVWLGMVLAGTDAMLVGLLAIALCSSATYLLGSL